MAEEPQKEELSNLLKVTCLLIGREREDQTHVQVQSSCS